MARRGPRPRALGLGTVVAAVVLAGWLGHPGHAQPAPDLERAKELYQYAETAMKDGRFEEAARDYGAAYELSKDPALFFKIGRADERAGKCDLALIYYARYLHDGKPTEQFVAMTRERMRACGGDLRNVPVNAAEPSPGGPRAGGSASATSEPHPGAGPGERAGAPGEPPPGGDQREGSPAAGSAGAVAGSAGALAGSAGAASAAAGSAGLPEPGGSAGSGGPAADRAAPLVVPSNRQKIAWITTGGAVALAALGGVLAYAASSSESDVRDLYVGFAGQPATFDAETKKKYDDLVAEGRRFQHLSWASFGLAGGAAVGAAVLFVIGGHPETAQHARITPIVTPGGAGVAVGF